MTIYCGECIYFDNELCKRYPPTVSVSESGEVGSYLPLTMKNSYCGEAEAKLKGPVNPDKPFDISGEADGPIGKRKPIEIKDTHDPSKNTGTMSSLINNLNALALKMTVNIASYDYKW